VKPVQQYRNFWLKKQSLRALVMVLSEANSTDYHE